MKYTLNIGCNVNEKPAFSPAFALSKVRAHFTVLDSAHFTGTYPNNEGKQVEEKTLVVTVDTGDFDTSDIGVFNVACILDQIAIAYAPEGHLELGRLEGPRHTEWDGGVFRKEFFVTLDEAKRRQASEELQREADKALLRSLGCSFGL